MEQASPDTQNLRQSFASLCRDARVLDTTRKRVVLDRLWWEVEHRTRFCELATQYARLLLRGHAPEDTIIISPDTISASFGATGVVFIAAHTLGYRVAVWKEYGALGGNRPTMVGTDRPALNCLVLQDVVRHGVTVLKMLASLEERRWQLAGYACFVLNCPDASRLQRLRAEYTRRANAELRFDRLITVEDLL